MDEVIGERVHTLAWRNGMTNAAIAREMEIDPATFSRRLRGERGWTASEVFWLSERFGVSLNVLYGVEPIPALGTRKAPTREGEGQLLPEEDSNFQPAGIKPVRWLRSVDRDAEIIELRPHRGVPRVHEPRLA
jgi:transcriptional regulator with XRE-family HTH domain